jgi:hypothetical protein
MYTVNGSVIWILCLVFWLAGKNSPPQGGGKFSAAAHVGFLCPMKITVFRVVKPRSPVERYIYIYADVSEEPSGFIFRIDLPFQR